MTALVIGATGAVGQDLILRLIEDPHFDSIHAFVRRDVEVRHPKLHVHIVDFAQISSWSHLLQGDALFSALGTTLKQAGGQQAQWQIDYTYQYEVARAARANGVPTMVLVSSAWATPDSKVFYTRMKGQLEEAVKQLGFNRLVIVRPPSLIRKGSDRFGEKASVKILQFVNRLGLLRSIRPMPTSQVAHAMAEMSKPTTAAVLTLEPQDIWRVL